MQIIIISLKTEFERTPQIMHAISRTAKNKPLPAAANLYIMLSSSKIVIRIPSQMPTKTTPTLGKFINIYPMIDDIMTASNSIPHMNIAFAEVEVTN